MILGLAPSGALPPLRALETSGELLLDMVPAKTLAAIQGPGHKPKAKSSRRCRPDQIQNNFRCKLQKQGLHFCNLQRKLCSGELWGALGSPGDVWRAGASHPWMTLKSY